MVKEPYPPHNQTVFNNTLFFLIPFISARHQMSHNNLFLCFYKYIFKIHYLLIYIYIFTYLNKVLNCAYHSIFYYVITLLLLLIPLWQSMTIKASMQ